MSAISFSSRRGLMLAMHGMAVGTGNLWRFPRIAANNGGAFELLNRWLVRRGPEPVPSPLSTETES